MKEGEGSLKSMAQVFRNSLDGGVLYVVHACGKNIDVCLFMCLFHFFRYVEEHVQRTGVAIETQGFSFVTNGRKRESLTVRYYVPSDLFHDCVNILK